MSNFILSIDTSCDDTSAAVTSGTAVLSNIVASQVELHKEFGGVFPTVAKQAHRERIKPVVELALKRAKLTTDQLAAIAVTQGPGLAPALEVGVEFAKQLAGQLQLPLLPINHIEGHVLSVLAKPSTKLGSQQPNSFPALSVIVSGGHTEFVLVKEPGKYQRIGWTVDDAAGEALDKFGRMVDLGYPAGPVVEEFAKRGDAKAFAFPLPMTTTDNFLMSFSGLKTAVRRKVEELESGSTLSQQHIFDLCASFQYAVFHAITYKLNKYLQKRNNDLTQPKLFGVWLGGGVAANTTLRAMLRETIRPYQLSLAVPYSKKLCSDNAAMIGVAAGFVLTEFKEHSHPETLQIERLPNWQIGSTTS